MRKCVKLYACESFLHFEVLFAKRCFISQKRGENQEMFSQTLRTEQRHSLTILWHNLIIGLDRACQWVVLLASFAPMRARSSANLRWFDLTRLCWSLFYLHAHRRWAPLCLLTGHIFRHTPLPPAITASTDHCASWPALPPAPEPLNLVAMSWDEVMNSGQHVDVLQLWIKKHKHKKRGDW